MPPRGSSLGCLVVGSTLIMRNVVQGSNDTQNLDIITFDANTDEMTVEVYVLK